MSAFGAGRTCPPSQEGMEGPASGPPQGALEVAPSFTSCWVCISTRGCGDRDSPQGQEEESGGLEGLADLRGEEW